MIIGLGSGIAVFAAMPAATAPRDSAVNGEGLRLHAIESEQFTSVLAMSVASDVVVVGQVSDVSLGRIVDPAGTGDGVPYANLTVNVEQVLRGALPDPRAVTIEVLVADATRVEVLEHQLANTHAIFFSIDKAQELARLGFPPEVQATEKRLYGPISSQGLIQDVGLGVSAPLNDNAAFAAAIADKSFQAIVAEARGRRP